MKEQTTILLVDDQDANLLLLHEFVEVLGFTSYGARNGIEALKRIDELSPDLILLDVMMPKMDGQQVLLEMMNHPQQRHIPVIMISAIDDMERVAWCIEQGAADFLVKPFNMTLLRARVMACLDRKRLHDQDLIHQQRHQLSFPLRQMIQPEAGSCPRLPQCPPVSTSHDQFSVLLYLSNRCQR